MERIVLLIILFTAVTCNVRSQNISLLNKKLDSLNYEHSMVNQKIKKFTISRNIIEKEIASLNQKKNKLLLEAEALNGFKVKINFMGGKLRDRPSGNANVLIEIPAEDSILVYNWYKKPYFKATYKEKVGFISYSSLVNNDQTKSIVNSSLEKEHPNDYTLIKKYGNYNAQRIIKGEYWIGMTNEMAKISLGHPDNINKSTGSWGVHEQWVYEDLKKYLYFENGKLSSFQD